MSDSLGRKYLMLVCSHKPDYVKQDDLFFPIQVGADLTDLSLGFAKDNTGDNISSKNRCFCELTALYWAWKNLKDVDYIGLSHYRRYFNLKSKNKWYLELMRTDEFKNFKMENERYIELMGKYDIILPRQKVLPYPLSFDYCYSHVFDDYKVLKSVVHEKYPDYYDAFMHVMDKTNKLRHFNMFFCSWNIFDDYCKWLFDILFEVEKRVDISSYSTFQKRIFGYMSERLLNVYVYKNRPKIYEAPVIWVNDDKNVKVRHSFFDKLIWRIRCNLSFFLLKKHSN